MNTDEAIIYYGDLLYRLDNTYFCKGGLGRFIDEICTRYKKVYFCAPVSTEQNIDNINLYKIQSNNLVVQELPPNGNFISALKNRRKMLYYIKKHSKGWNSPVYLRWPTPFVSEVYSICKKKNLPVTLHLVGDTKSIISESSKYQGVIKKLALLYISHEEKKLINVMKEVKTLVNGSGLRRLYQYSPNLDVEEIRSATITLDDLWDKKTDINKERINILYVGVLKKEKGLVYLIEAIKSIICDGKLVYLTIVGDGPELKHLKTIANEHGISNYISFRGYVALGPKLFDIYKSNDIFVLPSISEGTPRVLIEAMANKLFVIATEVGGVPFTINHKKNGLLVKPKDSNAIVEAITEVVTNDKLRQEVIEEGYRFAKENTLEVFVDKVVKTMKEY